VDAPRAHTNQISRGESSPDQEQAQYLCDVLGGHFANALERLSSVCGPRLDAKNVERWVLAAGKEALALAPGEG
jgi:hypothetical protein